MDGILTEAGLQAWLGGSQKSVHEYDTGIVDSVQVAKLTLFANSSQGKLPPNGSGITPFASTELNTSLVKEGRFATDNFVATHLGLEILTSGVYDDTAANDLDAMTYTEMANFLGRAFFNMYFTSKSEPLDKGHFTDFPWGVGLNDQGGSTAADTWITRSVVNGPLGVQGKLLRTPFRCNPDTTPRLDITFPRGAVDCTVDFMVRAHVVGVEGL